MTALRLRHYGGEEESGGNAATVFAVIVHAEEDATTVG